MKAIIGQIALSALPATAVLGVFASANIATSPQSNRLLNYKALDALYTEQTVPETIIPAPEVVEVAKADQGPAITIIPPAHHYYQFVATFVGSTADTGVPFSMEIAVSTFQSKPAANAFITQLEENEAKLHPFALEPMLAMTESALRDGAARKAMTEQIKIELHKALASFDLPQEISQVIITSFYLG